MVQCGVVWFFAVLCGGVVCGEVWCGSLLLLLLLLLLLCLHAYAHTHILEYFFSHKLYLQARGECSTKPGPDLVLYNAGPNYICKQEESAVPSQGQIRSMTMLAPNLTGTMVRTLTLWHPSRTHSASPIYEPLQRWVLSAYLDKFVPITNQLRTNSATSK